MSLSSRYTEAWESFWRETPDEPGAAIWDSAPELTAKPHLDLLRPHADVTLPVVDVGCGNGTQTRYLAGHFPRAVGVDLAPAAVEHARRADPEGTADFRCLDATDPAAIRALHDELGDVNVYLRAVIHQSDPQDRPAVAAAVATLAGARGAAFVVEPLARSRAVLQRAAGLPGGPPPKLARVFAHGLRPAEAEDGVVPALLAAAGLSVLDRGEIALAMTESLPDGARIDLPAHWLVLANRL